MSTPTDDELHGLLTVCEHASTQDEPVKGVGRLLKYAKARGLVRDRGPCRADGRIERAFPVALTEEGWTLLKMFEGRLKRHTRAHSTGNYGLEGG